MSDKLLCNCDFTEYPHEHGSGPGMENITCEDAELVRLQEKLDIMCADNKNKAAELSKAREEIGKLKAGLDIEMERLKACEHIAEGEQVCEVLFQMCPSTMAVSTLRLEFEKLQVEIADLRTFLSEAVEFLEGTKILEKTLRESGLFSKKAVDLGLEIRKRIDIFLEALQKGGARK